MRRSDRNADIYSIVVSIARDWKIHSYVQRDT